MTREELQAAKKELQAVALTAEQAISATEVRGQELESVWQSVQAGYAANAGSGPHC